MMRDVTRHRAGFKEYRVNGSALQGVVDRMAQAPTIVPNQCIERYPLRARPPKPILSREICEPCYNDLSKLSYF